VLSDAEQQRKENVHITKRKSMYATLLKERNEVCENCFPHPSDMSNQSSRKPMWYDKYVND